jgi:hypothetical protein
MFLINPITNPNPAFSYYNTWQYKVDILRLHFLSRSTAVFPNLCKRDNSSLQVTETNFCNFRSMDSKYLRNTLSYITSDNKKVFIRLYWIKLHFFFSKFRKADMFIICVGSQCRQCQHQYHPSCFFYWNWLIRGAFSGNLTTADDIWC